VATTATLPVQQALYTVLSADSTLMAKLAGGVLDYVPAEPAFPYVALGEGTEVPLNVFAKDGRDVTVTLHIWSRAKGFAEADGILDDLNRLLDHKSLTISGYVHIVCAYEFSQTLRDPDGFTRHIPVRFRVTVQNT
jgi:hypothetical protein